MRLCTLSREAFIECSAVLLQTQNEKLWNIVWNGSSRKKAHGKSEMTGEWQQKKKEKEKKITIHVRGMPLTHLLTACEWTTCWQNVSHFFFSKFSLKMDWKWNIIIQYCVRMCEWSKEQYKCETKRTSAVVHRRLAIRHSILLQYWSCDEDNMAK